MRLKIIMITLIIVVFFTNCSGNYKGMGIDRPDKTAKKFVLSLMNNDFETAIKCIDIPSGDRTFLTNTDIEDYLKNTDFLDIIAVSGEIEKVTIGGVDASKKDFDNSKLDEQKKVVVKITTEDNKNISKNILCVYDKNKQWKVVLKNAFAENWTITAPGESIVKVNGKEITKKYMLKKESEKVKYKIPLILKRKTNFTVKNDLVEETEFSFEPVRKGDTLLIPSIEPPDEALEYIKTSFNEMHKEYENGSDVSKIKKYFVSDFEVEDIERVLTGFQEMDMDPLGQVKENFDIRMTDVISMGETYVYSNDTIGINFGYTLKWTKKYFVTNDCKMKKKSAIFLKKENGEWKIQKIHNQDLYSYINRFTSDF